MRPVALINSTDAAGHRRDPARDLFHRVRVHIADDRRLAGRPGDLVDADVDDGRARLHHVGAEELRLADGDEHGVRAP